MASLVQGHLASDWRSEIHTLGHSANRGQFNTLLQLVFLVFKHKFNKHLLSASCGDPGLDHEALSEAGHTDRGLPAQQHGHSTTTVARL